METAMKQLREHQDKFPRRQLCHTVAEAERFWENMDWWYVKLGAIIEAMGEFQCQ